VQRGALLVALTGARGLSLDDRLGENSLTEGGSKETTLASGKSFPDRGVLIMDGENENVYACINDELATNADHARAVRWPEYGPGLNATGTANATDAGAILPDAISPESAAESSFRKTVNVSAAVSRAIAAQCCDGLECKRSTTGQEQDCISGVVTEQDASKFIATTWQEASSICEKLGYTLCHHSCAGTGCGYDYTWVWTSATCPDENPWLSSDGHDHDVVGPNAVGPNAVGQ